MKNVKVNRKEQSINISILPAEESYKLFCAMSQKPPKEKTTEQKPNDK